MRFQGKHAFVTGGASGMGRESARALLAEGAQVTILDQADAAPHFTDWSDRVLALTGDASDATAVKKAIGEGEKRFGPLSLAVNAAGIHGDLVRICDQPDDAMDRLLAVNVRGVFLAMKYEAESMRKAGGGAIVNFASVFSQGAMSSLVLYGSTKHAVVGLTQGAAVEFAEYGIRVNAISPGPIYTPFLGVLTPEAEQAVGRSIPQGRIGRPDEISGGVAWLLSEQASYVTGANLVVDGGQAVKLSD